MDFIAYLFCLIGICSVPEGSEYKAPDKIIKEPHTITPETKENQAQGSTESLIVIIGITIPSRCERLIEYFTKAENPSLWAAQIDQESTCNQFAKSPFANGVAQITPSTGNALARKDCKDLGPYRKFDDHWQMTCGLRLEEKNERYSEKRFPELSYCEMKAMGQKIYNGGYWAVWEYEDAGSLHGAELICSNVVLSNGRKRAKWACNENYEYPVRIRKRQPNFIALGGVLCE